MCVGTAQHIARRFVAILDLQDGYYTAVLRQHLIVVVNALRATGQPVTKYNVVQYALPHRLEGLHHDLHCANVEHRWLEDYLDDLTQDLRSLVTQMRVHLAALIELADVPSKHDRSFRNCARELGGSLVDLLQEASLFVDIALVWAETITICSVLIWFAFDRLGLAGLIERPLSLEQCLGLGLLVTFLINELTGRTDALAKRVAKRIASRL
jgi:hypothetical protein